MNQFMTGSERGRNSARVTTNMTGRKTSMASVTALVIWIMSLIEA